MASRVRRASPGAARPTAVRAARAPAGLERRGDWNAGPAGGGPHAVSGARRLERDGKTSISVHSLAGRQGDCECRTDPWNRCTAAGYRNPSTRPRPLTSLRGFVAAGTTPADRSG